MILMWGLQADRLVHILDGRLTEDVDHKPKGMLMKFIELLKTAWQSLKVNPKRSFLTMIGIIIGIAAVITIIALGNGVKSR